MNFRDLGLTAPILKALTVEGYTEPTPIQRQAIPPALAGRDVLGCAQTGTGKTCAFAAPILQRLSRAAPRPRVIRALVLTPTRELAIQIQDSFVSYGRNLPLRCAVIFGGVGQQPQVDAIQKGLDILVATPGRLLDLQGQGLVDLSHLEIFVLDEADRMLDMGFIHDVRRVLKLLPEKKQTLFFSATMPPEVMGLVDGLLRDYVQVAVDPVSSPVEAIRQSLYYVDKANKIRLLAHLMQERRIASALVFSRTKHGANRIAQELVKRGITAAAIHGNKSQTARVQALSDFKAGRVRVLAATDIAARGLDIDALPFVINYNLPDVPETYVHRIGRTGRAGREGEAISFCQFDEKDELKAIEKLLGKPIPVVEGHPFPMENFDPPKKDKNGRPVNAEDEEAREAARERRREQNAARAVPAPEPPGLEEEAPSKKKRRKKKKSVQTAEPAAVPVAAPAPARPVRAEPDDEPYLPRLRPDKPLSAGVRQGRLEDTLPKDPSMPAVDFVKPNPLDSDVIMDATARLLAPRPRPQVPAQPQPEKREEKKPAPPKPRQRKKGKRQGAPPRPVQEPALPPSLSGKGRSRRNDRPRPGSAPPRSGRQKDSTQQKSLMRPYDLHDDD